MSQEELLNRIKYHWHLYIARGGFNEPSSAVGKLEQGGQFHWTSFLQLGRKFAVQFPKQLHKLTEFINPKIIKLLTGE